MPTLSSTAVAEPRAATAPIASARPRWIFVAGVAVAVFPAVLYTIVLAGFWHDTPLSDDFMSVLPFAAAWHDAPTLTAKLGLLFEQYFSHRIVLTRLACVGELALLGRIDFRLLQIAGWCTWLGLSLALAFSTRPTRTRPWLALPVFFLLMNPQGFTNHVIAMQAVQNLGVVALAFAAIACAETPTPARVAAALGFAALATFTSANGLLVAPVLAVGFALRRQVPATALALGATVLLSFTYFQNFRSGAGPFHLAEFWENGAVMLGAIGKFGRLSLAFTAACGGALAAVSAAVLSRRATWIADRRLPLFLLFLLATIALAARGRIGWGADYMTQDRYRLYGLLVVATLYLTALDRFAWDRQRKFTLGATIASGALCALSYVDRLPEFINIVHDARIQAANRQLGHHSFTSLVGDWDDAAAAVDRCEQLGLYRFPAVLSPDDLQFLRALPATNAAAVASLSPGYLHEFLWFEQTNGRAPLFGVLVAPQGNILLPVVRMRQPLPAIFSDRTIFSPRAAFAIAERHQPRDPQPVIAVRRDERGQLQPLWSRMISFAPAP